MLKDTLGAAVAELIGTFTLTFIGAGAIMTNIPAAQGGLGGGGGLVAIALAALIGGHGDMHHVYWLGPILGGVAAALVYHIFLLPKKEPGA